MRPHDVRFTFHKGHYSNGAIRLTWVPKADIDHSREWSLAFLLFHMSTEHHIKLCHVGNGSHDKNAVILITNGPAAGLTSIPNAIIRRNIVINVCEPIVTKTHLL